MNHRIIRIAAALTGCILLATGCIWKGSLDPDGEAIRFTASSPLLREDATKGTPKEGTTFSVGDAFVAWSWHNATAEHLTYGLTTPITLGAGGTWDYDPHQFWNWRTGSDYYDFLAIYPAGKDISHTAPSPTSENQFLKASVNYNATSDQFDLMAAGLRRTDKSIETVHLTFQHLLSAVTVKVTNSVSSVNSVGSPLTITLKSCKFNNLISEAPITVTFDGSQLVTSAEGGRGNTPVLGFTTDNTELAPGASCSYPTSSPWDLMVPQNLNPDGSLLPTLEIVYTKGDLTDVQQELYLKDIPNKATGVPITEWKAGYKYSYEIELRIGVGIMVKVTTTPWEEIAAETPGLMI